MGGDAETIALYDDKASDYLETFQTAEPSPRLLKFIDALPEGGTVLDLGCGPGNSAAVMRDHGLQVTALDASAQMAALAKDLFDLDVTIGTFDDVFGTGVYDGIWANFSLLHAARADMPRHLADIHTALKTGGQFLIGLKTGSGEKRDTLGRFYTYYGQDDLIGLLTEAGFTPDTIHTGEEAGLAGPVEPWIVVTAHA